MANRKVVFIMGAGHCGSTLLDLILGSHSKGLSLAEFHNITKLLDNKNISQSNICVFCGENCHFWNKSIPLSELKLLYSKKTTFDKIKNRASRFFTNPYEPIFRGSGKKMLIDSSKNPNWIKRQLTPSHTWKNVTPYLINLRRDGRAIVNSYFRKYPEKGLEQLTQNWMNSTRQINQYYDNFPFENKISISYEELAQHPEEIVKKLCSFLNIDFEKEMLLYWTHDHHPISGNGGTQSLILKYREVAEDYSSDHRINLNKDDKYYQQRYYDQVGLAIKFDERWKRELSKEQIEQFDQTAGELNKM